ncbi:MAG: septum formation initiator family protein [Bacteroidaceae bacterium]|nr:septum formation initiator family protein [Bacteroidaceae bacterium]MBR1789442.1 septum formation initiator family protein [Bacteroidaceae bacterium]
MSRIYSVWGFIRRHKYFVVIAFFAVIVGFVDENSFYDRHLRLQEIAALKAEMQTYQARYERDTKALKELESNPEAVLRVAREDYLMKYPDEDVYVIMDAVEEETEPEENVSADENAL